jgi:cytochrome c5
MSLGAETKLAALFAALALSACGVAEAPRAPDAAAVARASLLRPSDGRLANLYAQSCFACHGAPDSGAPLAGDAAVWDLRLRKGMPALMRSTIEGLNGMPAGGQCFTCSAQDYEALIRFMATGEG